MSFCKITICISVAWLIVKFKWLRSNCWLKLFIANRWLLWSNSCQSNLPWLSFLNNVNDTPFSQLHFYVGNFQLLHLLTLEIFYANNSRHVLKNSYVRKRFSFFSIRLISRIEILNIVRSIIKVACWLIVLA